MKAVNCESSVIILPDATGTGGGPVFGNISALFGATYEEVDTSDNYQTRSNLLIYVTTDGKKKMQKKEKCRMQNTEDGSEVNHN